MQQILLFSIAAFMLLITPGPSVLYVTSRTLKGGMFAGMISTLGLACGDLIQVIAVSFGLAAFIAASPIALSVLKFMGAGYLIFLALKCLKSQSGAYTEGNEEAGHPRESTSGLFRQAILINALNPKSLLFFLSFLPAFIDSSHGPAWTESLGYGSLFVGIGMLTNGAWAVVSALMSNKLALNKNGDLLQRYLPAGIFTLLAGVTLSSI